MMARMHLPRLAFAVLLSLWLFGLALPGSGPGAMAHAQEAAPTTLAEPTVDLAALR